MTRRFLSLSLLAATLLNTAPAMAAPETARPAPAGSLALLSGHSQVLKMGSPLTRVAISDPKVMDVRVVGRDQLLVQGLKPGTSSLVVWTQDSGPRNYQVSVGLDAAAVERQILSLTANRSLRVAFNGHAFLLSGQASALSERETAEKIAASYGQPVVNVIEVPQRKEQIAIDVFVVELAKSSSLSLGVGLGGGEVTDVANGVRKYVFKPGELMAGETVSGNPASFGTLDFLAAKIEAMQRRGEAKLLARPTLVTTDGGTAKFLAGGEIPIPIQQALGTTTITWKEFGVRLEIQPTMLPNGRIALAVKPEVSSLDFVNGLKQASLSIPAIRTRRAETQVTLGTSETLLLGGLINTEESRNYEFLPGVGDVPVLGELFRSRRFLDNQSELAILVSPRLLSPDPQPTLPGRLPAVRRELEQAQ